MAEECCYTCENWQDAMCQISDQHDDENPNLFKCELYGQDEEEINYF